MHLRAGVEGRKRGEKGGDSSTPPVERSKKAYTDAKRSRLMG